MGMIGRITAAIAIAAFAAPAFASDTARVTEGTLQGATAGVVTSFKNIPFAAPPVGALRWRPPQPGKPWAGARDATRRGSSSRWRARRQAARCRLQHR